MSSSVASPTGRPPSAPRRRADGGQHLQSSQPASPMSSLQQQAVITSGSNGGSNQFSPSSSPHHRQSPRQQQHRSVHSAGPGGAGGGGMTPTVLNLNSAVSPTSPDPFDLTVNQVDGDDVPLTSYFLKTELEKLEADQADADRRAHARKIQEQVFIARKKEREDEQVKSYNAFLDQKRFAYAVPLAEDDSPEEFFHPTVVRRLKHRPNQQAAVVDVPDEPRNALLTFEEKETAYSERFSALALVRDSMAQERRAQEFDTEASLFDAIHDSSDDSDGYDEDVDANWRDLTGKIYATVRKFEASGYTDDAASSEVVHLLRELKDEGLTPTELSLIWDCVRLCYRRAEPLHPKHWLSSVSELLETGNFKGRPSVALFSQLVFACMEVEALTERHKRKLKRWANRSTYLVRKRVAVLKETGFAQPTWAQVNASCGGLSRDVPVPAYTLDDAMNILSKTYPAPEPEVAEDDVEAQQRLMLENLELAAELQRERAEAQLAAVQEEERNAFLQKRAAIRESNKEGGEEDDQQGYE